MSTQQRTVYWRNLATAGGEQATLLNVPTGHQLLGTALWVDNGRPTQVQYRVVCDHRWHTRSVEVIASTGATNRRLLIVIDAGGRWAITGQELDNVRGCLDVDLGCSPATNTLPIRRLALPVGSQTDLTAAWVRLPELSVAPLRQRYTRLAERRYQYESLDSGFTTVLDVDDWGLIVHYEQGWLREAIVGDGLPLNNTR